MASPFHTPSFGDEDFNLSLSQPAPDSASSMCFSSMSSASSQNHSPTLHTHSPTLHSQAQGQMTQVQGQMNQIHGQIQIHDLQGQGYPGYNQNGFHTYQHAFLPKFPPQNFDIPDIRSTNVFDGNYRNSNLITTTAQIMSASPTTFVNNSIGLNMAGQVHSQHMGHIQQNSPQGGVVSRTSPGRESSAEESSSDDGVPLAQIAQKRSAPEPAKPATQNPAKKPRTPKKRKKKDPNEPQKPVSAYALFFRDTQAAIKTRNPSASFGEVSKIVASMWDGLNDESKSDYKKRTELAKKEYLKQLAAYRATLVSNGQVVEETETQQTQTSRNGRKQQQQQQQQHRVSPPHGQILPNIAMTTAQMNPHQMSSPSLVTMPLSHMPNNNNGMMTLSHGHMVSPHHQQHPPPNYGMIHQGSHMVTPQMAAPHMMQQMQIHNGMSSNSLMQSPGMHEGYMSNQVMSGCIENGGSSVCIRAGCGNPAVHAQGWDKEYCSNDCVVNHCRDVFTQWVASRQGSSPYASVK